MIVITLKPTQLLIQDSCVGFLPYFSDKVKLKDNDQITVQKSQLKRQNKINGRATLIEKINATKLLCH